MKKKISILAAVVLMCIFASMTASAAKTGWSGSYYLKNGKKVTGLQKISGKIYYFDAKGKVVKSKSPYRVKSKGKYRYFDINGKGVAVEWKGTAALAAQRIYQLKANLSNPTGTKRMASLLKAFLWSADLKYVTRDTIDKSKKAADNYGEQAFVDKEGDCLTKAYALYWMAKVLGFQNVKVIRGYIPRSGGGYADYGWVEIKQAAGYRVYDPTVNVLVLNGKVMRDVKGEKFGFKVKYGSKGNYKYLDSKKREIKR